MKKIHSTLLLVAFLLGNGCGDSNSNGSVKGADSTLSTLSAKSSVKEILTAKEWKTLEVNLDQYYYSQSGEKKQYDLRMNFTNHKVEAIANCYRVIASYRIDDKAILFARLSFKPMDDVATCSESEKAEDAVDAFFSKSYMIEEMDAKHIVFNSFDEEATATLSR